MASEGFLAILGFYHDEPKVITWPLFLQLLNRVNWVKVEYARGIASVCLEDFDDELADEYANLVNDEAVADDALVENLKAYLAPWPQGCFVRHVLDHWERSRNRLKGSGRKIQFAEWVMGINKYYKSFTTFDFQEQVSTALCQEYFREQLIVQTRCKAFEARRRHGPYSRGEP